jgi:hypothetical protein
MKDSDPALGTSCYLRSAVELCGRKGEQTIAVGRGWYDADADGGACSAAAI